jgi:hypothetical protein
MYNNALKYHLWWHSLSWVKSIRSLVHLKSVKPIGLLFHTHTSLVGLAYNVLGVYWSVLFCLIIMCLPLLMHSAVYFVQRSLLCEISVVARWMYSVWQWCCLVWLIKDIKSFLNNRLINQQILVPQLIKSIHLTLK